MKRFTIDEIDEHLCEIVDGWYTNDSIWIGNTLVVASLDPSKENQRATLDTYSKAYLELWVDEANRFLHEDSGAERWEILVESQPSEQEQN